MTTQHSILRTTSAAKKSSDGSLTLLPVVRHVIKIEKLKTTQKLQNGKCHVARHGNGKQREH